MSQSSPLARLVVACAVSAACALPAAGHAQVSISVSLPHVQIDLGAPRVLVAPGVYVLREQPAEVFFFSGVYWTRTDGRWYRARSPRDKWIYVVPRAVPPGLARLPPGQHVKAVRHAAKAERKRHDHGDGHGRGPGPKGGKHGKGHGKGR